MISFSFCARIWSISAIGGVGRLLDLGGQALDLVLADVAVLLLLLQVVDAVAPDVAHGDAGRLGIFMRDLDQFLTALLRSARESGGG